MKKVYSSKAKEMLCKIYIKNVDIIRKESKVLCLDRLNFQESNYGEIV